MCGRNGSNDCSHGIELQDIGKLGADFKRQFDLESYKRFLADLGYANVEYSAVNGKMPCPIAVTTAEAKK